MNAPHPYRDESDREASRKDANKIEKKLSEVLKIGLPVLTLVFAVIAGIQQGAPMVILVLAGGALFAVIAVLWASVRTLVGETPLSGADAYALGAPRVEEEKKRAVLRALKDLEFERSVGKISDEDYQELVDKYRAEAKRLLRMLDAEAQPRRENVEALVNKRLRREGLAALSGEPLKDKSSPEPAAPAEATGSSDSAAPAKAKKRTKARTAARSAAEPAPAGEASDASSDGDSAPDRKCTSCGTMNDADAVFCKKCGARRALSAEASKAPAETSRPSEDAEASKAPAETSQPSEDAEASKAPAETSQPSEDAEASKAPAETSRPSEEKEQEDAS
jgi:hypothetical protein